MFFKCILKFCKKIDESVISGLNISMSEEISEKVINIFNKHIKNKQTNPDEKVKSFLGFSYVRMDEDVNGYPFKKSKLEDYAKECHYIVKVMREKDKKVCLYSYNVPNDKLLDFLLMFRNDTLNGTIIEIDKFLPKDLA